MKKWRVAVNTHPGAHEIEADKILILNNGALRFSTKQGTLVAAFGKDVWYNVIRIDDEEEEEESSTISE
jgi:hypothetical protein